MKKLFLALGATTLIANPVLAADEKSVKVEAGGGFITYGDSGSTGLMGRANISIPIVDRAFDIGIEVEGGTSIQDDEFQFAAISVIDDIPTDVLVTIENSGVQNHKSGYAFFRVPLDSGLGVTVRAGYHQSNFQRMRTVEIIEDGSSEVQNFDIDLEGPAAGLGIEYFFGNSKKNGIRFDFTWHDMDVLSDDLGGTWMSLNYMRRF